MPYAPAGPPAPPFAPAAPQYNVTPQSSPRGEGKGKKVAIIAGAAVALVGLVGGGLYAAGVGQGPTPAEKRAAALRKEQAALRPALTTLMNSRAQLFASERTYLSSMKSANGALAKYRKAVAAVDVEVKQIDAAYAPQLAACRTYAYYSCPSPDYPSSPDAPDLGTQEQQLASVSTAMTALHAQLVGVTPVQELKTEYAELLSAVDALGANAKQNAGLLREGVSSSADEESYVDETKLKGLDSNDALPSIKQMNRELVALLRRVQLPVAGYDLPGGTDIDPSDDSTAV